jgi:hypothetical protein
MIKERKEREERQTKILKEIILSVDDDNAIP